MWTKCDFERKAKIIATIGPSCQDREPLKALIEAGMNVARLNFSHGTYEEHAAKIDRIRELSQETGNPITILQDLQGPKLRIGNISQGTINLTVGQKVLLTSILDEEILKKMSSSQVIIPLDVPDLVHSVDPGMRILLDDGHLEMDILNVSADTVEAQVVLGGPLSSHKGVNLPGAHLTIPGFTEKDRADLAFGLSKGIDAVAISFVCTGKDIDIVREAIQTFAPQRKNVPIIAKLERPEAIDHLEEILHQADGVMVARGDLGVETSPAVVPTLQKKIIAAANHHAKTVITATQMLDSMIHSPRPTRAEASDVANAIFDGTDAVMLSGETANGEYPVESVKMMAAIVREAEHHMGEWGRCYQFPEDIIQNDAVSITRAATELAHDRDVAAIAVFTQTGQTAIYLSKARPRVPILAFTPRADTYHRLSMLWGVAPFLTPFASTVESMITMIEEALVNSTSIQPGQQVVLVSGFPVGDFRQPNFCLLHTIQESNKP